MQCDVINVRSWHIAAFKTVTLRHGVSWVGGSNPLVPTKLLLKNQPVKDGILCLKFVRGEMGGKPPSY
ncbi:TPA: hypothetical protein GF860_21210 [Citrobacter koseri]|nr:hypothetical protein [Citrobacter koseri]